MTDKVYSVFLGIGEPIKQEIGVEVEVEGNNLPLIQDRFWKTENDGSLRGEAFEYLLKAPIKFSQWDVVKGKLLEHLENSTVTPSDRTGIHVHYNVQNLSSIELMNTLVIYYILEEYIVSTCGPNRQGNHFCLRMVDSPVIEDLLIKACEKQRFMGLHSDDYRYAALNFQSLFRFGSLEFRAIQTDATLSMVAPISEIMLSIIKYAKECANPQQIIENLSGEGSVNFLPRVLKPKSIEFLRNNTCIDEDLDDVLYRGVRNIQDLAFTIDWDNFTFDKGNGF